MPSKRSDKKVKNLESQELHTSPSQEPKERGPSKPRLSLKEKLCYGIGDISNGLAVSSVSVWYLYYLTDVVGLAVALASAAVMIGRLWDAVTDPLMGWITDHTKSRWGKRLPYLLFGAIPYAIAYWALWSVPDLANQWQLFLFVTLSLLVFNTFLTVVFVPYTSLTAAITTDYNERTALTGYRMFCSQISFLIGASIPPLLVQRVTSGEPSALMHQLLGSWAGTSRGGYTVVAALFSLIMIASIWTTFFGVKEKIQEVPADKAGAKRGSPLSYALAIVRELRRSKPFLFSVLILLLSNSAATIQAANLPYYLQYVLGLKADKPKILVTLFLAAILSVPVWVFLSKRFGKAETYRVAMLLYVVILCATPFVGPEIGSHIYKIAAVIGFAYGAAIVIPWAIVPDVVEYDELENGIRREGLFYGGTTFSYKAATGVAFLISGTILQFAGYSAGEVQSESALAAIRFLIGPVPAMFLLAAALLAMRYPLTADKHRQIVDALAARDNSSINR